MAPASNETPATSQGDQADDFLDDSCCWLRAAVVDKDSDTEFPPGEAAKCRAANPPPVADRWREEEEEDDEDKAYTRRDTVLPRRLMIDWCGLCVARVYGMRIEDPKKIPYETESEKRAFETHTTTTMKGKSRLFFNVYQRNKNQTDTRETSR